MGLGILGMGPLDAEVAGLCEVLTAFLTGLVVGKSQAEVAVELIVDLITGIDVHGPGTQGIIVAGEGEVKIISEHEVHTGVPHIETSRLLLAEGGHQQTRGAGRLLGHKSKRQADGNGHTGHHRPCRAENRLLGRLGHHLGHTELEVIVGFLQVANGVNAVPQVDGLVRHHLDLLTLQEAFRLLGDHVGDAGLLGGEVVAKLIHLICLASFGHFRQAHHFSRRRIRAARGIDGIGEHIVFQIIRRELHILVRYGGAAIIINQASSVPEIRNNGVFGCRKGRTLQRALLKEVQGICPDGLEGIQPGKAIQLNGSEFLLFLEGIRQGDHLGAGRKAGSCQRERQDGEILKNLPCHWFIFCYFCAKYNLQNYYIFQNNQNCISL